MSKFAEFSWSGIALVGATILFAPSARTVAGPFDFTEQEILAFSPGADIRLARALVDGKEAVQGAGITTRLRLAHFLAQLATETGGLKRLDENLNYSEGALLRTFTRERVPEVKAKQLAAISPREIKERTIANWVYGDILGNNGRDTDDGWNYRGSGFIQLTGRGNFRARGLEVRLPLEAQPQLARQPREGLLASVAYWQARDINDAADDNDILRVRILVNGPRAHGLNLAKIFFDRARAVFLAGAQSESAILEATASESDAVAGLLVDLGFVQPGARESAASGGEVLSDALRAYQRTEGLPETGRLDLDTLYSIADQPGLNGEPLDLASLPRPDPETSAAFDLAADQPRTAVRPAAAGPSARIAGHVGTGFTVAETGLDPEESLEFENSAATYAAYEVAAGRRDADGKGRFVPFSVILPDERQVVVNTTGYPARAIVQIIFSADDGPGRQLCTGALISPDTVLTAGHCVHEGRLGGAWYRRFEVYPGRNGGAKPFGSCRARRAYALNGWVNAADPREARYYDLGALKLDCDLGNRTGWLGVRALADADRGLTATVEGYPVDEKHVGRQWTSAGEFKVVQSLKVFYQNDTWGGMSGSPVFSAGENSILAVHTNGLHGEEPWKSNNGATRITPQRLATIRGWTDDLGGDSR